MHTTNVTMRINMGLEDRILTTDEAREHFEELKSHISDIMPTPDDLDFSENDIAAIQLQSLELGKWDSYNMQLTISIRHEMTIDPATMTETVTETIAETVAETIAEAIYENGANCPITLKDDPNYFLYPYHSSIDHSSIVL